MPSTKGWQSCILSKGCSITFKHGVLRKLPNWILTPSSLIKTPLKTGRVPN